MLIKLNPKLNCNHLIPGNRICVEAHRNHRSGVNASMCVQQWIVDYNDTCSSIAEYTNIPLQKIVKINEFLPTFNCRNLPIGSIICLGEESETDDYLGFNEIDDTDTLAPGCVMFWFIAEQDTCYSISKQTKTSIRKIKNLNKNFNCSNLHVGDKLCLGTDETLQPFPNFKVQSKLQKHAAKNKNLKDVYRYFFGDGGSLKIHNQERKAVGVKPLRWDHSLAQKAYQYSVNLATKRNCQLEHSHLPQEGENLSASRRGSISTADAVKLWTDEKWHWKKGQNNHYSQLVWSGSTSLGCAKASGKNERGDYCEVYTCRYHPRGNIIGRSPF